MSQGGGGGGGGRAAVIFPGQGAQRVGMVAELVSAEPAVRQAFDRAAQILGYDVAALCSHGPAGELSRTLRAQPALVTAGVGVWRALSERGMAPICAAGHSAGEYAAWVAVGALDFDEAIALVARRAEFMEQAASERPGVMSAVLGLAPEQVNEICRQAASQGPVCPAGYNGPAQVVVSGETRAVAAAETLARDAGGRVIRLAVSGAFHSPLMDKAAAAFACEVDRITVRKARIPVAANATGALVESADDIRRAMCEQMLKPVLWEQDMRAMMSAGAAFFIEAGCGKVLTGLVARIAPGLAAVPVEDSQGLEQAVRLWRT